LRNSYIRKAGKGANADQEKEMQMQNRNTGRKEYRKKCRGNAGKNAGVVPKVKRQAMCPLMIFDSLIR